MISELLGSVHLLFCILGMAISAPRYKSVILLLADLEILNYMNQKQTTNSFHEIDGTYQKVQTDFSKISLTMLTKNKGTKTY